MGLVLISEWGHRIRSHRATRSVFSLTLLVAIIYCALYLAVGPDLLPGGNAWSTLLIFIAAHVGGAVCGVLGLPPLLGMLLAGLLLRNATPALVSGLPPSWSATFRALALGTIFLRSGLELDLQMFRRVGPAAVRLLLIPGLVEAFTTAGVAMGVLRMPPFWALTMGFILKAVGPAVVIQTMFDLQKRGLGALLFALYRFNFRGGGALAALVLGMAVNVLWERGSLFFWGLGRRSGLTRGPQPRYASEVEARVGLFWRVVAQPLLFGIIGSLVNLRTVSGAVIPRSLAIIVVGMAVRIPTTFLAMTGAGLTLRERVFVAIAWTPKATVQAALGAQPLDMIRTAAGPDSPLMEVGHQILTTSVFAILVCANVGVSLIHALAPRWLHRTAPTAKVLEAASGGGGGGGEGRDAAIAAEPSAPPAAAHGGNASEGSGEDSGAHTGGGAVASGATPLRLGPIGYNWAEESYSPTPRSLARSTVGGAALAMAAAAASRDGPGGIWCRCDKGDDTGSAGEGGVGKAAAAGHKVVAAAGAEVALYGPQGALLPPTQRRPARHRLSTHGQPRRTASRGNLFGDGNSTDGGGAVSGSASRRLSAVGGGTLNVMGMGLGFAMTRRHSAPVTIDVERLEQGLLTAPTEPAVHAPQPAAAAVTGGVSAVQLAALTAQLVELEAAASGIAQLAARVAAAPPAPAPPAGFAPATGGGAAAAGPSGAVGAESSDPTAAAATAVDEAAELADRAAALQAAAAGLRQQLAAAVASTAVREGGDEDTAAEEELPTETARAFFRRAGQVMQEVGLPGDEGDAAVAPGGDVDGGKTGASFDPAREIPDEEKGLSV
ncbi:hypothetical protein GPECTOR_7g1329 [Gonium pectorale]|uniref:Cation/H+ exchanger transmembrane domain-containing protein n=1 Tax=Gonium pectorale TaxID=33097 RepID=A0A150GUD4_GONPE|nr:hypothetical protein GPECTOR_7g1329 [Gonium pectorale]|eukprot:KXZ53431.1 hypothetical protein GPECTOR_7g1329 [Gonium pectorale]